MYNSLLVWVFKLHLIAFLFIEVAFVFISETKAQEIVLQEQINWPKGLIKKSFIENIEQNIIDTSFFISFEGASYSNIETKLPFFSKRIKISKGIGIDSIIFTNENFEIIHWDALSKIKHLDKINQNIKIEHDIFLDREIPYLHLQFVPLRKNQETGFIEKLTEFKLKVFISENQFNLKKQGLKSLKINSVLASGDWYKIKIEKDGIYKITYKNLSDLGITDFDNIKIFGNGGGQLSFDNNVERIDDLEEIPVFQNFGSDGKLNSENDYFLFFAHGPHKWTFSETNTMWQQHLHQYSPYSYYFIGAKTGKPKTIKDAQEITEEATQTIDDFIKFSSHEAEKSNLFGSGRLWLGEHFKYSNTIYDTTIVFENIISNKPVRFVSQVVSRSDAQTSFSFYQNDNMLGKVYVSDVNLESTESYYARSALYKTSYMPVGATQKIEIEYNKNGNCEGWLDYLTLNAYCQLKPINGYLDFRNTQELSDSAIHRFEITGATSGMLVWDVTNIHDVCNIETKYNENILSFLANGDVIRRFIVFDPDSDFSSPEYESEKVENQNLHATEAVDYVIVTHTNFIEQANELADFHRENSSYNVLVTTPEKIYNEFSSGSPDVSAIRDFMRFLYIKHGVEDEHSLKYLLLFGDGTYNNKALSENNPYNILTYQSANSINQTSSYVGDDFFSFLDYNEGDSGGSMDIGVGRFPVRTTEEADLMVHKVKEYNSVKSFRPWRNKICFIGDDGNYSRHMDQANQLATKVNTIYPEFAVQKIMLDAYKRVTSADGTRYPDVTKSIYDAIESGVLIMNYVGHGSEYGLAHERIVENDDISSWQNAPFYPLFVTATCEFSRFDDINTSAGENVLLNPKGGAIALLTTTRIVYSSQNFQLNQAFYDYAFQINENGERARFGDILRFSKNAVSDDNKRNFTLLGDPACQLISPQYKIFTDSLNDVSIENYSDTVSAFSVLTVEGYVGNKQGTMMGGFNGVIYASVYDKEQEIVTLNNNGEGAFTFKNRPAPIFQGKASVNNGRFNFTFVVPKDIAYNVGKGKIIYYADNGLNDAHGYFSDFYIGGKVKKTISDDDGPEISLFLNDTNFTAGGISGNTPSIYAILKDQSGINTSSMGVGHDITIEIDNDKTNLFVVNDYFETFQDDYTSGTVNYPLGDLSHGIHTVILKAWDINNNSSSASITFEVKDPNELVIADLINYPNPFSEGTNFVFEHNLVNTELEIEISVYSLAGELIHQINETYYANGYKTPPFYWNGKTQNGQTVGSGMYIYKLRVKTPDGAISEKYNRLIIL